MNLIPKLKKGWNKLTGKRFAEGSFLEPNVTIMEYAAAEYVEAPIAAPEFHIDQHRAAINKAFQVLTQEQVGAGSFGKVYRAYGVKDPKGKDEPANRGEVAVKVALPELVNPYVMKWFKILVRREAYFLHKFDHEHIVKFYDFAWLRCPTTGQKLYGAFKTEFLAHNAADVFAIERVSLPNMARFAIQIGSALDYMHDLKIVHHDFKRSNCMIAESISLDRQLLQQRLGSVTYKLIDFGIAKQYKEARDDAKEWEYVGGTAGSTSPEKENVYVLNKPYNPYKDDSYAFGHCLFEMIAGPVYVAKMAKDHGVWAAWNDYENDMAKNHTADYKKYENYFLIIRDLLRPEEKRIHVNEAVRRFKEASNNLM